MRQFHILWISFAVLVLDQASKLIVKSTMKLHESVPVLGDFFRLTYIENPGMAFGIRFGENAFFTVFALLASIAILIYLFKMKGDDLIARIAMAVIFGGAVGNLFDRLIRGRVVDFFDCEFFNIHIPAFDLLFIRFPGYSMERWPVFNVADMAVTIGMALLVVFIIIEKEHKRDIKTELPETETEMIR
jgi:signal peptidase II